MFSDGDKVKNNSSFLGEINILSKIGVVLNNNSYKCKVIT